MGNENYIYRFYSEFINEGLKKFHNIFFENEYEKNFYTRVDYDFSSKSKILTLEERDQYGEYKINEEIVFYSVELQKLLIKQEKFIFENIALLQVEHAQQMQSVATNISNLLIKMSSAANSSIEIDDLSIINLSISRTIEQLFTGYENHKTSEIINFITYLSAIPNTGFRMKPQFHEKIEFLFSKLIKEEIIETSLQNFKIVFFSASVDNFTRIKWLQIGKNKLVNKASLIYFLKELIELQIIHNNITDNFETEKNLQNKMEIFFADSNNEILKNVIQSLHDFKKRQKVTKTNHEEIISSILNDFVKFVES